MKLDDFQFSLPDSHIARYPLDKRSESKLLCIEADAKPFQHRVFHQVMDLIEPGDLLVFNDTKVIPARIFGQKTTGGQVELLVERVLDDQRILTQLRVSKSPRIGDELLFQEGIRLRILDKRQHFYELAYEKDDQTILSIIERIGQIPLPPYMHRAAEESDKERYQTVYARHKGSVAAPTAGLHFDDELLATLKQKGVELGYLTLHIGAGTFAPVRVDDIKTHQMHAEYFELSPALCEQIKATKARGGRVIAVGTTSLRSLEAASQSGEVAPYQGETQIFIYPGYTFKCVDALITNLHLPGSTLMMLVCAFGGHERLMAAYNEAVAKDYRFYSYGDAMWISRAIQRDVCPATK